MKITKDDYQKLSELVNEFKTEMNINSLEDYGMTKIRYAWDIYHFTMDYLQMRNRVSDYLFMRRLYDYLNDANIQTALIKILC